MNNKSLFSHRLIAALVAVMLFMADQISKAWSLAWAGSAHPVILQEVTSYFNFVLVWNYGISFGLFPAQSTETMWLLTAGTGLLSLVLAIWFLRTARIITLYGLGLVIGGAVGNIADRLQFGAVVDFLDFHLYGYHWPAFNIADSVIFLGVVLLLLDSILEVREENKHAGDKKFDS